MNNEKNKLQFVIYITPEAKQSVRTRLVKTRDGRMFCSHYATKSKYTERLLKEILAQKPKNHEMILGPVRVTYLRFVFPRPKSHYRTGKFAGILKASAPLMYIAKPDEDNLKKPLYDALEDARIFKNDSQICISDKFLKEYGKTPRIELQLEDIPDEPFNNIFRESNLFK